MRRNFPRSVKKAALERADGRCEGCGANLGPHNPPEVDHSQEDWEGGKPILENAKVLGRKCCHQRKTARATARRAKADRQGANYQGTKPKSSRPIPGSKASGFKKLFSGEVVRR